MTYNGIVDSIIFRNDENGYTVMAFNAGDRYFTAVGIFPMIREGESLMLEGEMRMSKYGEQFEVSGVIFSNPTDVNDIIEYLGSGLFKGIGQVKANLIAERFGAKTLEIMADAPYRLSEVAGISASMAEAIGETYRNRQKMQETVMFLQKHGILMSQIIRIYDVYKEDTRDILSENPYRLVDDVDGIGFLTADKIAAKLGVELDSEFRIMAGITHVLKEAANNGHTSLPEEKLIREAVYLLKSATDEQVSDCVSSMMLKYKLKAHTVKTEDDFCLLYALTLNYNTENGIAARAVKLIEEAKESDIDVNEKVNIFEEQNRIRLHRAQRDAVINAVSSGATVITGGPGTGKTTIIKCILSIFNERNDKVLLCAPTGRAAKRLSEATGAEAKTVHRMLGAVFASGKMVYSHNESNPLDADCVIVDEISMADIYIFYALLKAMKSGARLIIVGDKDQLPSVSAGNILSDIIESGVMPVAYLTEIYRQDADSLIIYNAHRINHGQMPEINNRSRDFFYDGKTDPVEIVDTVVSLVYERLPSHFGIQPADIQVLSPMKKGTAGVEALNAALQKVLNPNGNEIIINDVIFREGDKVMHAVNNYNLEWERKTGYVTEDGKGIFNGDIGYILQIKNEKMIVEFDDGKVVYYNRKDMNELILAYAVSVHKSQGCEFPAVILALTGSSNMLLNRNLLYTAVTRAKNIVVLVGAENILRRMVANNYTVKRYTLLKEFIWQNKEKLAILRKT